MTTHSSATARPETPHTTESINSNEQKIQALAEIICQAGDEPSAALLVLLATFEKATDPKTLAHTVKHLVFTRCGELNAYNLVEGQIAMFEEKLLGDHVLVS